MRRRELLLGIGGAAVAAAANTNATASVPMETFHVAWDCKEIDWGYGDWSFGDRWPKLEDALEEFKSTLEQAIARYGRMLHPTVTIASAQGKLPDPKDNLVWISDTAKHHSKSAAGALNNAAFAIICHIRGAGSNKRIVSSINPLPVHGSGAIGIHAAALGINMRIIMSYDPSALRLRMSVDCLYAS